MLTLVIALISCLGVVVASIVNYRAITAAARITAADPRPRRARGRPPAAHELSIDPWLRDRDRAGWKTDGVDVSDDDDPGP